MINVVIFLFKRYIYFFKTFFELFHWVVNIFFPLDLMKILLKRILSSINLLVIKENTKGNFFYWINHGFLTITNFECLTNSYIQRLTWFGLPSAVASTILRLGVTRCSSAKGTGSYKPHLLAKLFKVKKDCMIAGLHNKQRKKQTNTVLSFPDLLGLSP